MSDSISELTDIVSDLQRMVDLGSSSAIKEVRDGIVNRAARTGKSWSGSNIGYHANVYYKGLKIPPSDDRFSREWGLTETYVGGTSDNWITFDFDIIYKNVVGNEADCERATVASEAATTLFEGKVRDIMSITNLELRSNDEFMRKELSELQGLKIPALRTIIDLLLPKHIASRDEEAVLEGVRIAPHQQAHCFAVSLGQPFAYCQRLSDIAVRLAKHIDRRRRAGAEEIGTTEHSIEIRRNTNTVFLVHGHDEAAKQAVARFIEKLGLTVIILHEQANQGKTIIEKLEHYSDVTFAVVLYTPCDIGRGQAAESEQKRARQNVVFEHGYLIAKLGRMNVCAIVTKGVERPSDTDGILYIENSPDWKSSLVLEMQAAGLRLDTATGFPQRV